MKTEIAVVLDQSGSMQSIKGDAIGGYNAFLDAQKNLPGEATFSLVLFNHAVTVPISRVPLSEAKALTELDYHPSGMTALNDAIGMTITRIGAALRDMPEADRPEKVIIAVLTDGAENASQEYTTDAIKKMIEHQESKYAWEVIYLAANQDAFANAEARGIKAANTLNFAATGVGITRGYVDMSTLVSNYRVGPDSNDDGHNSTPA
jgi:hypothetical protein